MDMNLIKHRKSSSVLVVYHSPIKDTEIPTIFGFYKFGNCKIGDYLVINNIDRRIVADWAK